MNNALIHEFLKLRESNVRGALVICVQEWTFEKNSMPSVNVKYYSSEDIKNSHRVKDIEYFCYDSSWDHVYVIYNNEVVFYRYGGKVLKNPNKTYDMIDA